MMYHSVYKNLKRTDFVKPSVCCPSILDSVFLSMPEWDKLHLLINVPIPIGGILVIAKENKIFFPLIVPTTTTTSTSPTTTGNGI